MGNRRREMSPKLKIIGCRWLQATFHGLNRDSSTKAADHQIIESPCCGFALLASFSWCCWPSESAWPTTQPHRRQRSGIMFSNTADLGELIENGTARPRTHSFHKVFSDASTATARSYACLCHSFLLIVLIPCSS